VEYNQYVYLPYLKNLKAAFVTKVGNPRLVNVSVRGGLNFRHCAVGRKWNELSEYSATTSTRNVGTASERLQASIHRASNLLCRRRSRYDHCGLTWRRLLTNSTRPFFHAASGFYQPKSGIKIGSNFPHFWA